jgi:hypothetical protein
MSDQISKPKPARKEGLGPVSSKPKPASKEGLGPGIGPFSCDGMQASLKDHFLTGGLLLGTR